MTAERPHVAVWLVQGMNSHDVTLLAFSSESEARRWVAGMSGIYDVREYRIVERKP